VLYKLNGSTHLPGDVGPNPQSRALSPSYVLESSGGSATGRMVSETAKTHVLMQNLWQELSYISLICTIIM